MTTLLDMAIEASRDLPAELQDELARIMLSFVNEGSDFHQLTEQEKASFDVSLAQAAQGEFASAEELDAIWSRYVK
ncbi:hypothetical protein [Neorhizobium sp. NCHU2750]|uniref:hypothetical protein n=1 Tax=Neorhizobium sp. NCHU2750 TaxID=1825976 RepID=UPI000E713D89|nr:hypothetical protein NCHU2750_16830 [Neorhizobium sp. NCHU2750]